MSKTVAVQNDTTGRQGGREPEQAWGRLVMVEKSGDGPALLRGESLWVLTWRRFRCHRLAVVGIGILLAIVLVAVFAPWLVPHSPLEVDVPNAYAAPSLAHPLGQDNLGRDVLSRLIYGARVSMAVGLVAVGIYLTIGTILGSLAGYYRGPVDAAIMRFTDAVLSFPSFMIILAIVAAVGPSLYNVMIAIGVLGWPATCRLVRAQFLSLRESDFVLAARCLGIPDRRIILVHILPNAVGPLLIVATFGIAGAILTEAGLSFLGLGVQPPTPSWGNMLFAAQTLRVLEEKPWLWLPPGIAIALAVLSINFIGDALRDALDPRTIIK
ncbi:MAG: ABC transporter permease [Ardenticatenaceae bacterium]|nr:ABC transporter permease [Ardenticatenaceae bacterium]